MCLKKTKEITNIMLTDKKIIFFKLCFILAEDAGFELRIVVEALS
jgi:hypothetical protein